MPQVRAACPAICGMYPHHSPGSTYRTALVATGREGYSVKLLLLFFRDKHEENHRPAFHKVREVLCFGLGWLLSVCPAALWIAQLPRGHNSGSIQMGNVYPEMGFDYATCLMLTTWDPSLVHRAPPCSELGLSPWKHCPYPHGLTQERANGLIGWGGTALPGHGCFQGH